MAALVKAIPGLLIPVIILGGIYGGIFTPTEAGAVASVYALIVGVFAVPMSLIFGPDAYYFGVLPVLIEVGDQFGISAIHLAQASIIGEETVGFPISPMTGAFYLLVGLAKVDIGRHIRHAIGWAWLVSLGMLGVAFATGVIPVWVS